MKKIISLILVIAMSAMVFACGDNPEKTTDSNVTTDTPTTATDATTDESSGTTSSTTNATTTTSTTAATTEATTSTTGTTSEIVTPPTIEYPVDPYAHISFSNGNIVDFKNVVTLEIKTTGDAAAATVEDTEVTFGVKTKTLPTLRIKNVGTWVKATFTEINNAEEFNDLVAETGGWSVEAFYLDNSTTGGVRGIVCVTEANAGDKRRSGWGLAEDASGKPYFITGHTAENAYSSAYATSSASSTELVHVVGVYNGETKKVEIYINGVLNASNAAAGAFTAADKTEIFEGFNMANVFYIGNDPTVQTKYVNGDFPANDLTVVDIKLYDKALSADEVKQVYEAAADMLN